MLLARNDTNGNLDEQQNNYYPWQQPGTYGAICVMGSTEFAYCGASVNQWEYIYQGRVKLVVPGFVRERTLVYACIAALLNKLFFVLCYVTSAVSLMADLSR